MIKLIDYEIEPYDNPFLNVAARAFIQLPHVRDRASNFEKPRRSTINHFELPELDGFFAFLARVGDTIAARARRSCCNCAARERRFGRFRSARCCEASGRSSRSGP